MANINQDKLKAIEAAMSQIEKQFGKGAVMKLVEDAALSIDSISTGCLDLDQLMLEMYHLYYGL